MIELITVEEFAAFRDVSAKQNQSKIKEAIRLAQLGAFKSQLGSFYFDVLKNRESVDYVDLLEGCEFVVNKLDYEHQGLKSYLADLTYSRYILGVNVQPTPFGAHEKRSNDSQPVSLTTLKDLSSQASRDAGDKFKDIELYITQSEIFDRYDKCKGEVKGFNDIKISIL